LVVVLVLDAGKALRIGELVMQNFFLTLQLLSLLSLTRKLLVLHSLVRSWKYIKLSYPVSLPHKSQSCVSLHLIVLQEFSAKYEDGDCAPFERWLGIWNCPRSWSCICVWYGKSSPQAPELKSISLSHTDPCYMDPQALQP
jgi:hypothetical protein